MYARRDGRVSTGTLPKKCARMSTNDTAAPTNRLTPETDHLIPLVLGGTNSILNLWPEPYQPHPGAGEKDSLEDNLHQLVCTHKMTLADAQHCIASNWVQCWEKYVVPEYGAQWAAQNRHGW